MSSTRKTSSKKAAKVEPFEMLFDIGTIKHLGLQMYSTLPPVIGELVANAWDANATKVDITIPDGQVGPDSEIVVSDNGAGMADDDVRNGYMIVGRDQRKEKKTDRTGGKLNRPLMGRKGIGKFAGFGIASEVEVETVKGGAVSRFIIKYQDLEKASRKRKITFPPLPPTGKVKVGTLVTLRGLTKFHNRSIDVVPLRRGLARRFAVIAPKHKFAVAVNTKPISVTERNLQRLLDKDAAGDRYLWEFKDEEIKPGTGWRVSGWIGALNRTDPLGDGIQRGIAIMARGKLVQEPFVFNATVGQQYALSYLIGELHAEFVDEAEDSVATTRNSLVWDTEANQALMAWGRDTVNRIAREWAEKRSKDNEAELKKNPVYTKFVAEAERLDNRRAVGVADKLIRQVITKNIVESAEEQVEVVELCLDFLEFDAFWDLAEEISKADVDDVGKVTRLFREWEVVEAKEMARVTNGRITTIAKLQDLIDRNALEVPTLHTFLKEFPWVLDQRWQLIADEERYSKLLREKFPDAKEPEQDRRIDFLCVREGTHLVVVEIKRPGLKATVKHLEQIEKYVHFIRAEQENTTDPEFRHAQVVGYLLCGDVVNTGMARVKREALLADHIFVRRYSDLLGMVQRSHKEFLTQYERLRKAKLAQGKREEQKKAIPARATKRSA